MAFGITWVTIPSIIGVARIKDICSVPNGRTSHIGSTPTLGGIAIFIGLVLSTILVSGTHYLTELRYIIAGLLVVFFVGIKDDILIIDPYKKLAGQIIAALIIAVFADFRITNLYGLFHITHLPYLVSIFLTVFVFIVIINGFNLIDGIDGLASGVGIVTASTFGLWFWLNGNIPCTILSFSFIGSLMAFFWFNVFGRKNKIFLGDTGSLLIGFVLSVLVCRFLQLELFTYGVTKITAAPTVVCGILIVPLFDSFRVFILRVKQGKSPFKADRQHIHHRLLQLGCTHLQATLVLLSVNVFFIILSYSLRGIGIVWLMGVILGIAGLMIYFLVFFADKRTLKVTAPVHSSHFVHSVVDIWNDRNKMKKIFGNQPVNMVKESSKEKVTTD
jgi:UDP-N-acetylmuramyl pentapeptide phosphotransferase/UDP-N-acetylglucosamine-1-phosphate transferase